MKTQLAIHPVQAKILMVLLMNPRARFSELNISGITSDHFNFHIKSLLKDALIEKTEEGYILTSKGKEFANRFDTDKEVIERQAKVGVLVCCIKVRGGKTYYLMQERLKQPYYGFLGMITGKVKWGEKVVEAAKRELKEETNLDGVPRFAGTEHKIDYDKKGNLLEDKFFFICVVRKFNGVLRSKFEGGRNKWMTEEEVFASGKAFDDVGEVFDIVKGGRFRFLEKKYRVLRY